MIAGRTLLLADDSAAVQKVVELTFADEGMKVVSVRDGQSALEKLEQIIPDVVLADAFMPGLNGYELCRFIKDDQRYARIPVMLLVSSFAPFDETEAQRAGADDIMTKPFQSIRQLVNRVGSLLSPKKPAAEKGKSSTAAPVTPVQVEQSEPNVTVLVEAAQLETAESHEAPGSACAPDIEAQTADTASLDSAVKSPQPISFDEAKYEDTIEIEPQFEHAMNEVPIPVTPAGAALEYSHHTPMTQPLSSFEQSRASVNDGLLDLDETDFTVGAITDDVVLELDLDELPATYSTTSWEESAVIEPPAEIEAASQAAEAEPISAETTYESPAAEAMPFEPGAPHVPAVISEQHDLSPEVINAIAHRVIEQMSDQVVREIAWQVVPELSELLIRKKLEEQK